MGRAVGHPVPGPCCAALLETGLLQPTHEFDQYRMIFRVVEVEMVEQEEHADHRQ